MMLFNLIFQVSSRCYDSVLLVFMVLVLSLSYLFFVCDYYYALTSYLFFSSEIEGTKLNDLPAHSMNSFALHKDILKQFTATERNKEVCRISFTTLRMVLSLKH